MSLGACEHIKWQKLLLLLLIKGYEIFNHKPEMVNAVEFIEGDDTLSYRSNDFHEVDIDDEDLHIDMNRYDKSVESIVTSTVRLTSDDESTSKRKSQQILELTTEEKRKERKEGDGGRGKGERKNNKKITQNNRKEKRRVTRLNSKDKALVIEKALSIPSPWVTEDLSITADISHEQRQLIEFYVNPLQDLPNSINIR